MSNIKQCFTSRWPDGKIVEVDWSQLEVTLSLLLSSACNCDSIHRAGISMEFYLYGEVKKRNLEWYANDNKPVLHFENENHYTRAEKTISRFIDSDVDHRSAAEFFARRERGYRGQYENDWCLMCQYQYRYPSDRLSHGLTVQVLIRL